mmetsp:Transcript_83135/g.178226  ORF Transcript_83135/g.178226 Transcript_83135/m.178226 type:complete len:254 (+) Transcript_83135:290-1051(+)
MREAQEVAAHIEAVGFRRRPPQGDEGLVHVGCRDILDLGRLLSIERVDGDAAVAPDAHAVLVQGPHLKPVDLPGFQMVDRELREVGRHIVELLDVLAPIRRRCVPEPEGVDPHVTRRWVLPLNHHRVVCSTAQIRLRQHGRHRRGHVHHRAWIAELAPTRDVPGGDLKPVVHATLQVRHLIAVGVLFYDEFPSLDFGLGVVVRRPGDKELIVRDPAAEDGSGMVDGPRPSDQRCVVVLHDGKHRCALPRWLRR